MNLIKRPLCCARAQLFGARVHVLFFVQFHQHMLLSLSFNALPLSTSSQCGSKSFFGAQRSSCSARNNEACDASVQCQRLVRIHTMFSRIGRRSYETKIIDFRAPQSTDPPPAPKLRSEPFDRVLETIKSQGFKSLGHFLVELFRLGSDRNSDKSKSLSHTVASFLNGRTEDYDVISLVDILYSSRFSLPKAKRASLTPNDEKHRPDETIMARHKLQQWAVKIVEEIMDKEAEKLVLPTSTLRVSGEMTWEFATSFSFTDTAKILNEVICRRHYNGHGGWLYQRIKVENRRFPLTSCPYTGNMLTHEQFCCTCELSFGNFVRHFLA